MICPVCNKDALIVEYNNIELDYCPACQGVWFDGGELELLLDSARLGDYRRYMDGIINTLEAATTEKKRKCPICRHKMKKTYIDEEKKILVDVCRSGEGIWFDGGEVQSLVQELAGKSGAKGAAADLLSFVSELFKHQKK